MAVSARTAHRPREPVLHQVDQQTRMGVQDSRSTRGGSSVGREKKQTDNDYEKLSRGIRYYYDKNIIKKGAQPTLRVSVCVRPGVAAGALVQ